MKINKLLILFLFVATAAQAQLNLANKEVKLENEESINSSNLEFAPVFYQDGIVFTTTQSAGGRYAIEDSRIGENLMTLWRATRTSDGSLEDAKVLGKELLTDVHTLGVTFNSTGEVMYFTRNDSRATSNSSDGDLKKLNIYSAQNVDGKWENISQMTFNEDGYNTIHPTIHPDQEELYFSSNRPGGYGGYDLYMVRRIGGEWSAPINLGPQVNTPQDEVFPYIHPDNTLYFSSTGHTGLGGLDIFYTIMDRERWTAPVSLGEPFNSSSDDIGFIIDQDKKNGYLSSDRSGGKGGDDIYRFSFEDSNGTTGDNEILVTVIDAVSNESIEGAKLSYVNMNSLILSGNGADNIVIDRVSGQDNNLVFRVDMGSGATENLTDNEGKSILGLSGGQYALIVSKDGYLPYQLKFNVPSNSNDNTYLVPLDKAVDCVPFNGVVSGAGSAQPGVTVVIKDVLTGEESKVITDNDGNYEYCLKCGREYEVYAIKGQTNTGTMVISTIDQPCNQALAVNRDIAMPSGGIGGRNNGGGGVNDRYDPNRFGNGGNGNGSGGAGGIGGAGAVASAPIKVGTTILLPNIYYNFNDCDLRPDAMGDLNLVKRMLEAYPDMKIELVSHTDSRGSSSYNQRLSECRSEKAVEYLVEMGVSRDQVVPVGMGERRPRNRCSNGRNCSERDHQENRRTEIVVTNLGGGFSPAQGSIQGSDQGEVSEEEAIRRLSEYAVNDDTQTRSYNETPSYENRDGGGDNRYFVIAGTFRSDSNAQSRLTKVQDMGFYNAEVIQFDYPSYHAVCVDKFNSENEARNLVSTLQSEFGVDSYVRRME
ncbi:MAG: OmpA family protein [Bacteroidota bacterium]